MPGLIRFACSNLQRHIIDVCVSEVQTGERDKMSNLVSIVPSSLSTAASTVSTPVTSHLNVAHVKPMQQQQPPGSVATTSTAGLSILSTSPSTA